jgi:putative ABC transport system substrate-binding protein
MPFDPRCRVRGCYSLGVPQGSFSVGSHATTRVITLLGGAAVAWPLAARAQPSAIPVIGFLHSESAAAFGRFTTAFREGLRQQGYVENQNVLIEQRWAEGHSDRLPALASDLVQRRVAVIATMGGTAPAIAAKAATTTIPVSFVMGGDPVQLGLVVSLNRPGGNVTGVMNLSMALGSKRLGLLHEIVPNVDTVGVLVNPTAPLEGAQVDEAREVATRLGVKVIVLRAKSEAEIEATFASFDKQRIGALLVVSDPYFLSIRQQLVAMVARDKVPTMYEWRDFPDVGGLMSYGTDLADAYRQNGIYVERILKGDKPAELPVVRSTKFEFVLNLRTARGLGIEVPPGVLSIADEVIE